MPLGRVSDGRLLSLRTIGARQIEGSARDSRSVLVDAGRDHAGKAANKPVPSHWLGAVNTVGADNRTSLDSAADESVSEEDNHRKTQDTRTDDRDQASSGVTPGWWDILQQGQAQANRNETSLITGLDQNSRGGEFTWLMPVRSAGTEGSLSEKFDNLESPVAPSPHVKTVLEPNESGSGEVAVAEGGAVGEADAEVKGAGGRRTTTAH